jgi:hypothetical protein
MPSIRLGPRTSRAAPASEHGKDHARETEAVISRPCSMLILARGNRLCGEQDVRRGRASERRIRGTRDSLSAMNAALTARVVAAGRIGFGLALIVSPERVTTLWLRGDAGRAGTRVVTRGLGARDLALGAGVLAVAESELRPWVAAAILADTADLIATVAAGDSLPLVGRLLVGAVASGGSALGVMALAGLPARSTSA